MDELAARRAQTQNEIEAEIERRRAARMEKQFEMFAQRRKMDEAMLGNAQISDEEEEVYNVTIDEDGEIEVEKEEEK